MTLIRTSLDPLRSSLFAALGLLLACTPGKGETDATSESGTGSGTTDSGSGSTTGPGTTPGTTEPGTGPLTTTDSGG